MLTRTRSGGPAPSSAYRILLDPTAETGGVVPVSATPPPAAPTPAPVAATPPAPPAASPPTIPLTVEEYQRLRETERRLGEFQAEKARELQDKESARLKALADKGESDKALAEQRATYEARVQEASDRYANLESLYLGEKKANVIGDALAGIKFVSPDAERDARAKLAVAVTAARDAAGTIVVRDPTGRPAADVIREALASPAYAHFLAADARGGTHRGSAATTAADPPAAPTPEQRQAASLAAVLKAQRDAGIPMSASPN
jgi:hypothetical protein